MVPAIRDIVDLQTLPGEVRQALLQVWHYVNVLVYSFLGQHLFPYRSMKHYIIVYLYLRMYCKFPRQFWQSEIICSYVKYAEF